MDTASARDLSEEHAAVQQVWMSAILAHPLAQSLALNRASLQAPERQQFNRPRAAA
jgi:hypothetical protein